MDEKIQKDRIRGSLIGGAIGDALGYPVEFIDSYAGIQRKYGNAGITRLDTGQWWKSEDCSTGKAWVSDDTQMTLFTACGILNAKEKESALIPSICEAYIEWYYTQSGRRNKRFKECWIGDIPELNQRRAPGNTCLTALSEIIAGRDSHNNSKGCGGVMRIAPIPLYGVAQGRISDIDALDRPCRRCSKTYSPASVRFYSGSLYRPYHLSSGYRRASGEGDIQKLHSGRVGIHATNVRQPCRRSREICFLDKESGPFVGYPDR